MHALVAEAVAAKEVQSQDHANKGHCKKTWFYADEVITCWWPAMGTLHAWGAPRRSVANTFRIATFDILTFPFVLAPCWLRVALSSASQGESQVKIGHDVRQISGGISLGDTLGTSAATASWRAPPT